MAKAKTQTTTHSPVTPSLDDPLAEEGKAAATAAPATPYDRALSAGEDLRRKPYEASTEIQISPFSDWTIAFEYETEGVETCMAAGALCDLAMFHECFAKGQIPEGGFIARQFRNRGGRRRNSFAEQAFDHPVTAFDGTGPKARRVCGKENAHGQKSSTTELVGMLQVNPAISPFIAGWSTIMLCKRRIHESVRGIEEIEDRSI